MLWLSKTNNKQGYVKGVSCPYCFEERSEIQKKNSLMRQKQIDKADKENIKRSFEKIKRI